MARYMDFVVSYRFIVLVLVVLFLVVGYFDVATVDLVVDHHLALVHDKVAYFSKGSHDYYRRQPSVYDEVCRVQFIFAGSKHDYNNFPTLQSWIRFADPKCPIEFLRTNHPFVGVLTTAEARMFHDSAFLPILQADMLKFFAVYYLGGLVVDLDVQAIKPFPEAWIGKDSPHSSCDVILGIEANCYDDECVKTMVRKGQVPNWAMFVRRPRSQFLGDLLDFVVAKYESMAPLDKDAAVQEVAGSGTITDFVQQYGNFTTPHYQVQNPPDGNTLALASCGYENTTRKFASLGHPSLVAGARTCPSVCFPIISKDPGGIQPRSLPLTQCKLNLILFMTHYFFNPPASGSFTTGKSNVAKIQRVRSAQSNAIHVLFQTNLCHSHGPS